MLRRVDVDDETIRRRMRSEIPERLFLGVRYLDAFFIDVLDVTDGETERFISDDDCGAGLLAT